MYVVTRDELPLSEIAHEFIGEDHGGLGLSFLLVEAPPGRGPARHQHAYAEIVIVQEGEALFVAGGEERMVRSGDIVVIPAETPHEFVNTGEEPLRQIDIHLNPRFVTEWLERHEHAQGHGG